MFNIVRQEARGRRWAGDEEEHKENVMEYYMQATVLSPRRADCWQDWNCALGKQFIKAQLGCDDFV